MQIQNNVYISNMKTHKPYSKKPSKSALVREHSATYGSTPEPLTFEKVWLMFQETDKKFQETDKKFQETDKKSQETERKFQETERMLTEKFLETDKLIKNLANLFTTQWGKLVEALLAPGCLKMFKDINIKVNQSSSNVIIEENGEKKMEIDVLLVNDSEIVVIEVKTTSTVTDVKEFLEKLKKFKIYFKEYANYKVYGAIAALRFVGASDTFAEKSGLFVIKSHGEGLMKIINQKGFQPRGKWG